jgi:hypothetical protein
MEIIAPIAITSDAAAIGAPVLRSSANATYWDRNGVLQTAAADTPRITYDPADLSAAPYLLIEPAATNVIPAPGPLTGVWFDASGSGVYDEDKYPDPTGGNHASRWTSGYRKYARVNGTNGMPVMTNGAQYTMSVFVRPVGSGSMVMRLGVESPNNYALFDMSTMTVAGTSGNAVGKVSPCANGWYRLSTTLTADTSGNSTVIFYLYSGGFPFDVWGDQIEVGALSSYTVGARAADILNPAVGNGLLWSNVAENDTDDGATWSAATAYAVNAKVRRPNHRTYLALQASTNKTPETNTTGATPIWQDVGPTKRFAVFDNKYSTTAGAAEVVTYLLRPGAVATAAGVLGLDGNDVRVSVVDAASGAQVYRKTKNLRIKNCRSLTDYLFKPISRRRDEVFDDLPPFKNALICVTVTKPGSTAQVADIVAGRLEYLGETQWAPEIRSKRRSIITDDGFGNLTFTKRRKSKLLTVDVSIDNALVDDTTRLIDTYTDQPCVIIGDARWTVLIILGFVQDFRLVLESPAGSLYNAQIEGFA